MHGTVGVVGVSTSQNIFGIPGTPSFGDILKKGVSLIPGVGPVVAEFLPGGGGLPGGGLTPFTGQDPCKFGFSRDFPGAPCTVDLIPGPIGGTRTPVVAAAGGGAATVGQFGVGMEPGIVNRTIRTCLRGMQLGSDGLCYNKGVLRNNQREHPRGRRPLLTGGDMRCISVASRASKKLQSTTKRLQKMGMLPKATTQSRAKPKKIAAVPAGTSIVNVE